MGGWGCCLFAGVSLLFAYILRMRELALSPRGAKVDRSVCCRCGQGFASWQWTVVSANGELSHTECAKHHFRRQRGCVVVMAVMACLAAGVGAHMVVGDLMQSRAASHSPHLSHANVELSILVSAAVMVPFLIWYWRALRRQEATELCDERPFGARSG